MHRMDSIIVKTASDRASANLINYEKAYVDFTWDVAIRALTGLPGGGLNIAFEAVDRHAEGDRADKTALCWHSRNGNRLTYSYAYLAQRSNRFASVLYALGIEREQRVFSLLDRVPELYVAMLGTLKAGCVYCPLFSSFGPEPVLSRMQIGDARVLVTNSKLFKRKVAPIRNVLPNLKAILLIDPDAVSEPESGIYALHELMLAADSNFDIVHTKPNDPALLHFTSGTTGKPKGALHVHGAVIAHHITGRVALNLHSDDIYWCTADPGWVTGTSYGIIAPLTNGVTLIVDEADFDVERWYHLLESEKVTVWYTAPTAIRMLMKAGPESAKTHDLSTLRFLASVGEPLNPEAISWSVSVFGHPFHDNWLQTETGGIMIANYASMDLKPGSMGKPLPGITASIVSRNGDSVIPISEAMTVGELALRSGWPSMMRAYIGEQEQYDNCFADGWYLSGDLAMQDADGYFWFVGRKDDLIKSAGHLNGPFEIENVLTQHEAVAEVGVVGISDDTAGEIVNAYVA
jgi:acetyl-CoA synthetase